jgi:flagellar FliL protein
MAKKPKEEAEEEEEAEGEAEEEGGEEEGSSKPGGKKKLLIIIAAAVLLVIGGVAAAYFTGLMQPLVDMIAGKKSSDAPKAAAAPAEAVFIDLPEILVNLNTGGRRATFLKMRVSLELERKEHVPVVEKLMPRIVDNFQVYLRELRVEDLKGSAGMYRLREELLTRVVAAAAPAKVNDVLFKEMLVQ